MEFDANRFSNLYTALQVLGGVPNWPEGEAEKKRIERIAEESSLMRLVEGFLEEAQTMPIASRYSRTKPPYSAYGKKKKKMSRKQTEEAHKRAQLQADLQHVRSTLETAVYQLINVRLDMMATGLEGDGTPASETSSKLDTIK